MSCTFTKWQSGVIMLIGRRLAQSRGSNFLKPTPFSPPTSPGFSRGVEVRGGGTFLDTENFPRSLSLTYDVYKSLWQCLTTWNTSNFFTAQPLPGGEYFIFCVSSAKLQKLSLTRRWKGNRWLFHRFPRVCAGISFYFPTMSAFARRMRADTFRFYFIHCYIRELTAIQRYGYLKHWPSYMALPAWEKYKKVENLNI